MPSSVFPVPVLQNGIKVTNEPPKGIKANIGRTYNDFTEEVLNSCSAKPTEWQRLLFSLSFFHAVVQERRKFGPLGWNIRYEFNASDLECSSSTLRMFLTEQAQIPWDALEYVIGQINYGGRVTDDLDRRCLMSILRQYVAPRIVERKQAPLTASGTYMIPLDGGLEQYQEYIRSLPR
jgi:dynein heavy chain